VSANAEVSEDTDECNNEEVEEVHQRRVEPLWQKVMEVAFIAGGVGVRVGLNGMAGVVLGERLHVMESGPTLGHGAERLSKVLVKVNQ